MFNTKSEVDKHVENCLKKISNEKERNNRNYTFAKLYYNVGDYEQTRRYVTSYLTAKPKSPEGHYLLGLALEKLGKKDAALEAYRTSLQLDPKQNNLVLKVCELLASDDMDLDISGAKYFCELAENVDPHNPSIYNLKEKLMMREEKNPESVTKLLLKELENRPTDVNLRIRLLRNFVQNNKINEAYKHVYDIEEKNLTIFSNNLMWYEVITDVVIRYKREAQPGNLTWRFWCLLISVLDKVLGLRLDEKSDNVKQSSEYISQLFLFDQSLFEASQNINDCPDRQLSTEFLNHYRGQLYLHFATTIFKQAKKDLIQFKEASSITLPLLFLAYGLKPIDLQAPWINHLQEYQRRFVKRWHQEAAFRCSQSGHTLSTAAKDRKSIIMSKASQYSSGMWQEQLFKKVFVVRDQQLKMNTSFFVTNHIEVNLKLPNKQDLLQFDEESLFVFPDSLQHYIWVSLNNELADLKYLPFQGLPYSVKNLNNCGAETLNWLDIQAFVYCATLCSKTNLMNFKQMLYYNMDRPDLLPEAVTGQLGSIEQTKFLIAAYKMYRNEPGSDLGEMRISLIRGIEAVRCIGRHGLDVAVIVKLADIFSEKGKKTNKQSEIESCDARAEIYWRAALPLLDKIKNNQAISYSTNRLFEYKTKDMSLPEIINQIDKGKLFLGILAMKRKEHEKALTIFEELKDPYASFHQGQIYKQMADHQMSQNKESLTSEMRSQNIILLSKARDCFYLTLDRLREPSVDKNHPLNAQLGTDIEKIERLLSRIDPDCANRNECDGMSDENVSSNDSAEHYTSANYTTQFSNIYNSSYVTRNDTRNNQSTPLRLNLSRKEARPSPERLDAQLRQMVATKDATINQVLEQNKIMLDSHRSLVDELRGFKEAVYNLSGQVDNLKSSLGEIGDIKKSVSDLKTSVDEMQSFRNVTDLVYELKREIVDMKKDNAKSQHVNNDLYVLDDEYPDYNLAGNVNFNPNLYQNYPSRLPPSVPPPAALYPHGLYPGLYGSIPPYAYANLGLTQPGLPYGAEQQLPPDLRGLANSLTPVNPLYPTQPLGQPPTIQPPLNLATSNVNQSILNKNATQPTISQSPISFSTASTSTVASTKSAPVNVVITSSDPLPSVQSTVSQPVLSVTIPPQHIKANVQKSQPHNYQIPLPTSTVTSTPSVLSKPAPPITTEGILSNVAPPIYSAVHDKKSSSKDLGLQIEKSLEDTFASRPVIHSNKSLEIPSDVVTPNEKVLFQCPAKLYIFLTASQEFKERGSGLFKLLENSDTNTVRILMRQDLGKVIANHFVTKDMKMASKKDNAYYWSTLDYSDGSSVNEKFCLKFKNADDANKFYEAFEKSKHKMSGEDTESSKNLESKESSAVQTENKFGGFVFTSSPIFKTKEAESTPPQVIPQVPTENKTQSPFANFSFGVLNKSSVVENKNTSLLSNISTPAKIEEVKSPNTSRNLDDSQEFVPTAEFKPVIPLPDMVEVKTGEENSEALFDCRAKLLRFDAEKKEWKERGLGNIKILKEKTLIRLLMRREQIHKVCCNHQLLKSMNFQYMPNNFKALTWCAQDFADEVLKSETFAIRFKTEEQATDFLRCILDAQASLNDDNLLGVKESPKKEKALLSETKGFGDKFKPAKGSWECKNCYITNDSKVNKCVACELPKPLNKVASPPKPKESEVVSSSTGTKNVSGWGDAFKPKAGSWECQCCLIRNEGDVLYCVSCESPKDDTVPKKESSTALRGGINLETPFKFNFGIGVGSTTPAESTKQETPAFKFGTFDSTSGFGFGNRTFTFQTPPVEPPKETSNSFVFGSPAAHEFEFKPRSPRKSSGNVDEESDCSYVEEESDNIYFKPVIPLPNKVEVKTGEEDDDVLYCHRSKLFRFADGEWKERGIGDLKILRNKNTKKLRVLMRRDQVLKICLNHALTSNVEYLPKDDKTWLFNAADFSEGEVAHQQFCVRFKTAEVAQEFKVAVTKALNGTGEPIAAKEEQAESDGSSDVEVITETTVTAEEVKEAQRLGLPPKFFAYRKLDHCKCSQCVNDDEYFKGTMFDEKSFNKVLASTPKGKGSDSSISSASPTFHTPSSFSFGQPQKQENLKDLLVKPPSFPQSASKESVFNSSAETSLFGTPVSSSVTTAGNLFGSKFSANNSLFGSKPASVDNALKSFSFLSKASEGVTTPTTTPTNSFPTQSVSSDKTTENKQSFFGGAGKTTNVFGSGASVPKDLFGSGGTGPATLFGGGNQTSGSIFGNTSTKPASNIFSPAPTTNIFGTNTSSVTTTATNIFGSNTSTTASIFGTDQNKPSVFDAPKSESKVSPFGSINTGSLFGNSNTSLFGSGAKFEFGKGENIFGKPIGNGDKSIFNNTATQLKTADLKEDDEVVLKCNSDVSFSTLAKQSEAVAPVFDKPPDSAADIQPFAFIGAGAPVFGSKKKQEAADSTLDNSKQDEDGNEEEGGADEEYDPHYEPIIPMPDAIVVSTGEEEETAMFNERAKLFRYDADLKEWKERGVGQMKILYHSGNGTYRFLLRREQVHKVVLNQLITPSLELQPMTTSDKAWVWGGYNYVEGQTNLEKLAVRFKYQETAQKFYESVKTCLDAIAEAQVQNNVLPATIQNYGLENISSDSYSQDENYQQDNDNEYDEDPYDEDYEGER